jgi:hypothetical protein
MFYIKPCPACGKKLRFPLDKGKLQVKCECGNSFTADPDDTALYKNGAFDLKDKVRPVWLDKITNLNVNNLLSKIITNLLEYKYSLQNFMLLTWKDRTVIVLKTIFVLLVLAFLFFLIFYL